MLTKYQFIVFVINYYELTMTLRIEDIEEFKLATRIPRAAIDAEVLSGVRQLNESTEIEPYLREIISDQTETAHTSTEIADIVTHLITIKGKPVLSAFVNKGKATRKVTSKLVSHQIMRLQTIPGVELMVLAATGDIQDDAKRDLLLTADNANAQALFIDAVDLARLFIAHHKVCPKDGISYKNGVCKKCGKVVSDPIELTIRVFEKPAYEIQSQSDGSSTIKTYSAKILTNSYYPKSVLREVIALATEEMKKSRYRRLGLRHDKFGDADADCVWLFVYLSQHDQQQNNWVCRSLWVNPNVPEGYRPLPFGVEDKLGEIEIDWNFDYQLMREFWSERRGDKQGWLEKTKNLFSEVTRIEQIAQNLLEQLDKNQLDMATYTASMTKYEADALALSRSSGNAAWPPLECENADDCFTKMVNYLHNAFIPFASWGQGNWTWENKLWLVRDAIKNFENAKGDFRYEWKRLGGSWQE